jgi:peptidoglycan/xylan/chitin deacetylase (PgdA/CDA1 family)
VIPPILCYHKVDTRLELGFTRLGPAVFRRQVESLAKAGYAGIGSQGLADAVSGLRSPVSVVFTFDDGYTGLADHAFPVLADHGFKAIVFVITDFAGRENTWDIQYGWRTFRHLDWDALGRWQERGIEVHSHGTSHARMTWLSDTELADEMGRSREAIASRLGSAPAGISYPFAAVDARVRAAAVRAGYTLGFAGPRQEGAPDPMQLPRLPVYAWDAAGIPFVMREGTLGGIARGGAKVTNAIAVGTSFFQKVLRRRY